MQATRFISRERLGLMWISSGFRGLKGLIQLGFERWGPGFAATRVQRGERGAKVQPNEDACEFEGKEVEASRVWFMVWAKRVLGWKDGQPGLGLDHRLGPKGLEESRLDMGFSLF